jgi:hypothetical protein
MVLVGVPPLRRAIRFGRSSLLPVISDPRFSSTTGIFKYMWITFEIQLDREQSLSSLIPPFPSWGTSKYVNNETVAWSLIAAVSRSAVAVPMVSWWSVAGDIYGACR